MPASFSAWIWSPQHSRHYCCSYDEHGSLLEYHWSGVADAPAAAQPTTTPAYTQAPSNPVQYDQPRTPQATPQNQSLGYNVSYSPPGGYTTLPARTALPLDIQESVGGDRPRRHIRTGNDGQDHEKLDTRFARVVASHIPYFFVRGRVFKMLWTEPAGQATLGQTRGSTHFSVVTWNEVAYSEIRRFVVINNKGTFSQCIPIQSYRGKGATKQGLQVQDHGVIYTGDENTEPPTVLDGEEITKEPIRVLPKNTETLIPSSRINYGKPYAVEHNVKVLEIGNVIPEHMHLLEAYFASAMKV